MNEPATPQAKVERQELILSIIREKSIRTQEELLAELERRGLSLTQATLSRELKALGVAKGPDGRGGYRYLSGASAGEGPLAAVAAFVHSVARSENLLVVKTPPGNAQGVARGIDREEWPEIMGTIGGDDTILIICHDAPRAARVERRLKLIARGPS
jgi:transcriptional regulator of arginine metabolism